MTREEIIQNGQQIAHHFHAGVLRLFGALAFRAFAEIIEFGLPAQQCVTQVIPLHAQTIAFDAQLIEFLTSAGRDLLVAGTKADRLSGNGRAKALAALREAFGADNLLLCSAKTGTGMKELWAAIREAART